MDVERLRRKGNLLLAAAAAVSLFAAWVVCGSDVPLGLPGEWVWKRRDAGFHEIFFLFLFEVPVFLAIGGAAWWLAKKLRGRRLWALVPAILLLGGVLHYNTVVWDSGPGRRGENIVAFLDVFTGGYLNEAAHIQRPGLFFAGYAEKLSREKPPIHHLAVHPPGNVFGAWLVLNFARNEPAACVLERFLVPDDVRSELAELMRRGTYRDLAGDPAAGTAAALLLGLSNLAVFGGLLAVLLAFFVLEGRAASSDGLLAGAFFALYACGGPVLFTGHFDTFLFFWGGLSCLAIALTMTAKRTPARLVFAALTGLVLAAATSCTLAFGAMILLAGAGFLLAARNFREGMATAAVFAAAGLLFVAALKWFAGVDLPACIWYASENNAAFYEETRRSFLAWWPYNLADVVLFTGTAVLALMAWGLQPPRRIAGTWKFRRTPRNGFNCLAAAILLLLIVSPFSRGEFGRLIVFFMPCCLLAALPVLNALLRAGCSRLLLAAALLSNVFLVFTIRLSLKLVIGY